MGPDTTTTVTRPAFLLKWLVSLTRFLVLYGGREYVRRTHARPPARTHKLTDIDLRALAHPGLLVTPLWPRSDAATSTSTQSGSARAARGWRALACASATSGEDSSAPHPRIPSSQFHRRHYSASSPKRPHSHPYVASFSPSWLQWWWWRWPPPTSSPFSVEAFRRYHNAKKMNGILIHYLVIQTTNLNKEFVCE